MNVDNIISMNRMSIREFGGLFVEPTNLCNGYGKLSYALDYCTYVSRCPVEQAAFLCEKIACGHPFNDGNKRTAFLSCVVYMAAHDIRLEVDPSTIRSAMLSLIDHSWDYVDFADYLKQLM